MQHFTERMYRGKGGMGSFLPPFERGMPDGARREAFFCGFLSAGRVRVAVPGGRGRGGRAPVPPVL